MPWNKRRARLRPREKLSRRKAVWKLESVTQEMVLMKGSKRRLRYKTEIQVEGKGVMMLISGTLNWTTGSNWGFLRWLQEKETHGPTCLYFLQSSGVSTCISPGTWRWTRHARGLEDILIISGSQLPSGWPLIMISYGLNCVPPHKSHMLKPYILSALHLETGHIKMY